jgi:K+/H+ antiporter YhaU regulatory subunit KhtT
VRIQESLLRLGHYRALRGLGTTSELLAETRKLVAGGILETVYVMPGSPAAGKTLGELRLQQETGVVVLSVVRDETPLGPPSGSLRIEAEDLLVIFGPHAAIERALALFEASVDSGNRRPRASRSTASVAQRSALDE